MRLPQPQEVDAIAAEAAGDIRELARLWAEQGAAALDAAVRGNPEFSFAVLEARRDGAGAIQLLAMRPASRGVLLTFGQTAKGQRRIVAHGIGLYVGFIFTADPALTDVAVSGGSSAWSATDSPAAMLAAEMAWRFDAGVTAAVETPADFAALPDDFASPARGGPEAIGSGLLATLDGAAAVLAGRTTYTAGLDAIVAQQANSGLPEKDRDLFRIYSVDSQRDDLANGFEFRRKQNNGAWTWEQELADFEVFARTNAEAACRSLLDRFRSGAFAGLP